MLAQRVVAQFAPECVGLNYDIAPETNSIVHLVAGETGKPLEEAEQTCTTEYPVSE